VIRVDWQLHARSLPVTAQPRSIRGNIFFHGQNFNNPFPKILYLWAEVRHVRFVDAYKNASFHGLPSYKIRFRISGFTKTQMLLSFRYFSEKSFGTCSDDSSPDHLSASSDVDSFDSKSSILSDQNKLKQAFQGAVNDRKLLAREWRTERECEISHAAGQTELDDVVFADDASSKKSYLQNLLRMLHITRKKNHRVISLCLSVQESRHAEH
jgi:hypothetical protein